MLSGAIKSSIIYLSNMTIQLNLPSNEIYRIDVFPNNKKRIILMFQSNEELHYIQQSEEGILDGLTMILNPSYELEYALWYEKGQMIKKITQCEK